MKIYLDKNVFDAALDRIRFLFDEFENMIVGFSGGKDSTVCFNLALMIAKEKNRLPLKVLFIDQEAEWGTVIDYIRDVMGRPDVDPLWFQIPLRLFNATSPNEPWLHCWGEGEEWMREKEPNSIKVNDYGTDRFAELFDAILKFNYSNKKTCIIGGVRTEESPARAVGLTYRKTYKHITYGKKINDKLGHYTFYPLYDWSYTDIWKSIHDNNWTYCDIYDIYYQHGIPLGKMRVSNLHHETAIHALYILQEIEPGTWGKLTERLSGINTAGQLQRQSFHVSDLPYMFNSWVEYRDYLLDNLLTNHEVKEKFKDKFIKMDKKYSGLLHIEKMHKEHVNTILLNDYHFTKLKNWECRPGIISFRKQKNGFDQSKYKYHRQTQ